MDEMVLSPLVYLLMLLGVCTAQHPIEFTLEIPWYIWVIICVGAIITTLLVVFFILLIRRVFCNKLQSPDATQLVELNEVDTANHSMGNDTSGVNLELNRKNIKLSKQLGIGEFGPIYDAEVQLGVNLMSRAAVKVFHQGTSQDLVRFREEMNGIMYLQHPHVGRLFGLVSQAPYYAVLELTINGDLKTFLVSATHKTTEQRLSSAQLVAMATDVASGLSYLESRNYVHEDVAARNCIVTQNLSVKIADFKLGRYLHRSEYAVQNDGSLMPIRWMAPESLTHNKFTLKSTVWGYGVLLWEVMSRGAFPFHDLSDPEVVSAVCSTRDTLLQPAGCPHPVYREMLRCWNYTSNERPTMLTLHSNLQSSILTNTY